VSLLIEDLSVTYGDNRVLDSLDLSVETGERFAIMGPSGSGKSSLIRAIAGIVPSTGSIRVDGIDVTNLPTHERPIGLMFQDYALFPHMSVEKNIAYGMKMNGTSAAEQSQRSSEMLDRVGLSGFGNRSVTSLSGGEQQRVALARTLAPEPSLVMLDEPLGSLDLALRESLLTHMRTVVTDLGTTTLYVTHDRGEAFAFADRVAVLIDGHIGAVDTPEGLWKHPGTVEVAQLIGHQTVIDGSDIGLEGWIAIPPHAVRIDPTGSLQGQVSDSIFADGQFQTTVEINNSPIRLHTAASMPVGQQVTLTVDTDQVISVSKS
jgi:thiamine transport system ATP-binding protein